MARYYFPGVDPVGRRMDVGRGRTGGQIEIVGVAADVRYRDLRTPPPRMVYVPAFQREADEEVVFAIRSEGDPASLMRSRRNAEIQAVVPAILTTDVKTLVAQRDDDAGQRATPGAAVGMLRRARAAAGRHWRLRRRHLFRIAAHGGARAADRPRRRTRRRCCGW